MSRHLTIKDESWNTREQSWIWSTQCNSVLGKFMIKFLILLYPVNSQKQWSRSHPSFPGIFTLKYIKFLYFETYKIPAEWSERITTLYCSKCTWEVSTLLYFEVCLHSSLLVNSPEYFVTTKRWLNVLIRNSIFFFLRRERESLGI